MFVCVLPMCMYIYMYMFISACVSNTQLLRDSYSPVLSMRPLVERTANRVLESGDYQNGGSNGRGIMQKIHINNNNTRSWVGQRFKVLGRFPVPVQTWQPVVAQLWKYGLSCLIKQTHLNRHLADVASGDLLSTSPAGNTATLHHRIPPQPIKMPSSSESTVN